MTASANRRKQDRAITFLTQEEVQRLFSAIKTKRDRAIFAVAYRSHMHICEFLFVSVRSSRIHRKGRHHRRFGRGGSSGSMGWAGAADRAFGKALNCSISSW